MSDPSPTDEYEGESVFAVIAYFGQLILKVANVRLETVGRPHLNREEVMIALLELLTVRVLSEKQLSEISEVVD